MWGSNFPNFPLMYMDLSSTIHTSDFFSNKMWTTLHPMCSMECPYEMSSMHTIIFITCISSAEVVASYSTKGV